jgi:hypothetical protein
MTLYIIPGFLFGFFIYKLYVLLCDINKIESDNTWIKVEARILDSRINKQNSKIFKKMSVSSIHFFADFNVDDVRYGVTEISIIKSSKALLRKAIRNLGSQKTCHIYYNKDKPHISYLINPESHVLFGRYFSLFLLFAISLFSLTIIL